MENQNPYSKTDRLITRVTTWMGGIVLIVLAVWGIITLVRLLAYEETNDAQLEAYINPITARVSGFITEIRYDENQEVKSGDTLLVIDNREYRLQLEEAAAGLQNAKSQVAVLESNVATASKVARVHDVEIAAARAKLVREEQEYERYRNLFEAESATRQQMENVQSALEVARSEYEAAMNNYQASLSRVNDNKSQISPVLAEIKRRQMVLQRHSLDVSYTVITAPYRGRMGRRMIQTGQQIQVGQTLGYIVDKETGLWVVANFKETQLHNMHIGAIAEIRTDAYPGIKIKGTISSLSPATGARFSLLPPDNSTGNFVKIVQRIPVKIKIDNNDPGVAFLSAGMNVHVAIQKNQ